MPSGQTALDARLTERDTKVDAALAEAVTTTAVDTRHEEFVSAMQETFEAFDVEAKAIETRLSEKMDAHKKEADAAAASSAADGGSGRA